MDKKNHRLNNLLLAVEEERKQEEQYYLAIAENKSKKEKIKSGFLLYPLDIAKKSYSLGEYVEVQLDIPEHLQKGKSKLRQGAGCQLIAEGHETKIFKGTVSKVRKRYIQIILRSDIIEKDSIPNMAKIGVEMVYDERPYKIMKNVLTETMKDQSPNMKEIKNILYEKELLRWSKLYPGVHFDIPDHLNESQKKAIEKCLQLPNIGVIHGPPGTGKTTTLIALIKLLLQQEKRILVCAPSNNAVDLLAHLLDQIQVSVLRIGNISKIGDRIGHLTIEEQVRGSKEWNHIKKVKIEANEARRQAKTFKRSFDQSAYQNRKAMYKEARDLNQWAQDLEARLVEQVIEGAQVIATTLIGINNKYTDNLRFDTVIIDEASQAQEPECWNVIKRAKRVILAGDHKQLPPTIKNKKSEELGLSITMLDQLADISELSSLLKVQYRMHKDILGFSNAEFYKGLLESSETVANRKLSPDSKVFQLIDTVGTGFDESFNQEKRSYKNDGEIFILSEHAFRNKEQLLGASIGIISPYAEQVNNLKDKVEEDPHFEGLDIEINSIDGFQGQEKDVIYISMVRSNPAGKMGFLSDPRRLNVAMTRAKKKLVIIGDMLTLGHDPLFQRLMEYAEKLESYESAWEYMGY